jgi:hypothetical protein
MFSNVFHLIGVIAVLVISMMLFMYSKYTENFSDTGEDIAIMQIISNLRETIDSILSREPLDRVITEDEVDEVDEDEYQKNSI